MKTTKMNTINTEVQTAAIKLFHSVVETPITNDYSINLSGLIKYGILPVNNNGVVTALNTDVARLLIDTLGLKATEWTASFHKSWDKVATASIEQLVAEQIINYIGSYGMEALGLTALNLVPVEKILVDLDEKPALEAFTVVRVLTEDELKAEFVDFLQSVKAPHRDSIEYIKTLLPMVKDIDVDSIKSFEIKIIHCDLNNCVPVNGQDFLRFAIYKATSGQITTVVKDTATINILKNFANTKLAEKLFELADLEVLSESFYRLKPLFLAFKENKKIAPKINKIRRYATINHKPMTGFAVKDLMNLLSQNRREDAIKVIERADIRELIKLINFANYELTSKDHIYNIRNGKMFVKVEEESNTTIRIENIKWLLVTCKNQIKTRLNGAFDGITFYIPDGLKYVAPVSEKQMLDVLPYGSKVIIPDDAEALCIGGHWFNDKTLSSDGRIDLDFHLTSVAGSFGWNSGYRSSTNDVLYSGDMTNAPAPNGAVEAFRLSSDLNVPYQLSINIFNTRGTIPYELIFTKDVTSECRFSKNEDSMISAVINPANAIAPKLQLKVHESGEIVGYYYKKAFTVYGGGIGGNRRVPNAELMLKALEASIKRCDAMMDIVEFIKLAGGNVVRNVSDDLTQYVNLSMSNLTITTLFDVVDAKVDKLPVTVVETEEEIEDSTEE